MEVFLSKEASLPKEFPPPSHFLQTDFWASFKEAHGWQSLRLCGKYKPQDYLDTWTGCDEAYFTVSVLIRRFALPVVGKLSLAYVPMGIELPQSPQIMENSLAYGRFLYDFSASARKYLDKKTLCLRFDVPVDLYNLDERKTYRKTIPCKLAPDNIQPPDTVLVDLTSSPEEILARMKSKWRYNIRLAEKKGVQVHRGSFSLPSQQTAQPAIDIFYDLYKTTSQRDGIAIHQKSYYQDLLERGKNPNPNKESPVSVDIYIASYQGEPLASIITLFAGKEAVYLYGASSNNHRNLMPAYLLQWKAMEDARAAGCQVYDMYGIPPTDDESHPMHGLYRFKTGFGGTIVHRPGSIDIPLSPLYKLYVLGEKARNFWYKRVKKFFAGR